MRRKITDELIRWKDADSNQPYMLVGARQVGKTYALDEFCRTHFEEYIYINLEKDEQIFQIFENSLDPETIIQQIGFLRGEPIDTDRTVIFLDEIQRSERAIVSLKYFAEHSNAYRIVTAGSLLGVAINRFSQSFPVGKVRRGSLYPMDFEEYLWALDQEDLAEEIAQCYHNNTQMFSPVHDKLISLYKDYLFVGGMPASILAYLDSGQDLNYYPRAVKGDILSDYLADMNKYTTTAEALKIKKVFESIPVQLGRENSKFSYKLIEDKGRKSHYQTSIEWLLSSQLVYRANLIERPRIPLKAYQNERHFKMYLSDVGLLSELSDMTPYDLFTAEDRLFSGMLTENYVAQLFSSLGMNLYYWKSGNSAEVDFLVNIRGEIIPIEVKASTNTKSKALRVYTEKYKPSYAIRVSGKNFGFDGNIKSVPLYAVHLIGRDA